MGFDVFEADAVALSFRKVKRSVSALFKGKVARA